MGSRLENCRRSELTWRKSRGITFFVVWAKPNPRNKCVTQLGTPITVTSIDIPLILVTDKSNTREASRVTIGGL
jgi:hypothetical protein